jgi:hypothetical protein
MFRVSRSRTCSFVQLADLARELGSKLGADTMPRARLPKTNNANSLHPIIVQVLMMLVEILHQLLKHMQPNKRTARRGPGGGGRGGGRGGGGRGGRDGPDSSSSDDGDIGGGGPSGFKLPLADDAGESTKTKKR